MAKQHRVFDDNEELPEVVLDAGNPRQEEDYNHKSDSSDSEAAPEALSLNSARKSAETKAKQAKLDSERWIFSIYASHSPWNR